MRRPRHRQACACGCGRFFTPHHRAQRFATRPCAKPAQAQALRDASRRKHQRAMAKVDGMTPRQAFEAGRKHGYGLGRRAGWREALGESAA